MNSDPQAVESWQKGILQELVAWARPGAEISWHSAGDTETHVMRIRRQGQSYRLAFSQDALEAVGEWNIERLEQIVLTELRISESGGAGFVRWSD